MVRIIKITSLAECLVCEVTIQNKIGYVAVVYRSPSQSTSEFESFLSSLEDLLSNTFSSKTQLTVVLGDLDAKITSMVVQGHYHPIWNAN